MNETIKIKMMDYFFYMQEFDDAWISEKHNKAFRKCINNGCRCPNGSIIKMLMTSSVHKNKLKQIIDLNIKPETSRKIT